jgi:hypothetical protein
MVVLDGIDDAVVKLDGEARFVAMNVAAASIYERIGLKFFEKFRDTTDEKTGSQSS